MVEAVELGSVQILQRENLECMNQSCLFAVVLIVPSVLHETMFNVDKIGREELPERSSGGHPLSVPQRVLRELSVT